ncbi:MAG: HAD family hydrolase [Candidatus Dormibacteria bacterium]
MPVIFDMGGVLLRGGTMCAADESGIFNKLFALGGPNSRTAKSVWHAVMQSTETGATPEAYAWEKLAAISRRLGASEIREAIMDDVYQVPSAIEILRTFKARGQTTGIASNHYESWMTHWIRKYPEMFALVDHVYFSQTIGHRKPSPEFFESVMKSLDSRKGWFIDDRREDCVAAAQSGLTAVFFRDEKHCEIIEPLDAHQAPTSVSGKQNSSPRDGLTL